APESAGGSGAPHVRSSDSGLGFEAAYFPPLPSPKDQCFGADFVPDTAAGQFRILTGFPRASPRDWRRRRALSTRAGFLLQRVIGAPPSPFGRPVLRLASRSDLLRAERDTRMVHSRFGRARHVGLAGLLAVFAATGCKQSATGKTAGAAPSTSGATTAAPGGPCKEYAAKVCAKAGEESPTCDAFKASADLMAPSACTAGLKELAYTEKQIAGMRASCDELVKTLCDKLGKESTSCELVT